MVSMQFDGYPQVQEAHQYALDVVEGRLPACQHARRACLRHLADLEKASAGSGWPYVFDPAKASRPVRFIELLPHVKGKWARSDPKTKKPSRLLLQPWQKFILCSIFGWVHRDTGLRRFQMASIYIPRKNGKSSFAAAIGLFMLTKDGEPGAEVYCGATTERQAWEVFGMARQMCLAEPKLPTSTGMKVLGSALIMPDGGKFMPVIGKPGDGASPHCFIVDEYHEHLDSSLLDTMRTGTGAREQALGIIISTAGDNLRGPCREDWRDVEKLLAGDYEDDTKFGIIFSADDGDDWTMESTLVKANPNWGVSVLPQAYLPLQQQAIRKASEQAVFKTKHLNMWVGAKAGWANMQKWAACADPSMTLDQFDGGQCWIGIDAAAKVDVFSMVVLFQRGDKTACFAKHFLPEETIELPENAHLRKWRDEGWLTQTEGARTDQAVVEQVLRDWSRRFAIECVAYDPREMNYLMGRVQSWAGFDIVEVNQGPAHMSEPMKELEALIEEGRIVHQNDPVLNWMMSNVVRKQSQGTVKYYYPSKERGDAKIDGVVALIMALGRKMLHAPIDVDFISFGGTNKKS
jgi:phage terminase large subunit-like protein